MAVLALVPDPDESSEPDERHWLQPFIESWMRSLKQRDLSANTQRIYRRAAEQFASFLATYEPPTKDAQPAPYDVDEIHREHVEAYIIDLRERTSAGNAHQHFRSLKTFFNWLVDEEELDRSPMRTMKAPEPGEVVVPVIPDDALKRLLAACKGKTFEDRRDTAIILTFLDTGGRLSEVTNRQWSALDLDLNVLYVLGKGNRERPLPFGKTTALALDRYRRALAKHWGRPVERTDPLWVSVKRKDALTIWGVGTMIKRRCEQAGLEPINPHRFRHTFAHLWKVNGGNEDALMRIMGWRSREMLSRYGKSAGEERARLEHRNLSPGDRL